MSHCNNSDSSSGFDGPSSSSSSPSPSSSASLSPGSAAVVSASSSSAIKPNECTFHNQISQMFQPNLTEFHKFNDYYNNLQLNYFDKSKLEQLLNAHAAIEPTSRIDFKINDNIMDVLKFTEFLVRNIIKMAKRIPGFKKLCQEDQIALLKGGVTEIIILRSTMSLNVETESWENVVSHLIYN